MNTSELTSVRAGFIPLVDCAVLVAAKEKGFAEKHGIDLILKREVSWANIRDHINVGFIDVAHMLAGMPLAQSLGISHITFPMIAPMALGVGGNAITVSCDLHKHLQDTGEDLTDPLGAAKALRKVVAQRHSAGLAPLSFGQVFPFSCHNYQLRYWMAAAGIDPDRDVRLVVIPPPYMVKSLEAGQVDGFCVGEPWNTLAGEQGVGVVLLPTTSFWPVGPEKVLGMSEHWADANPDTLDALLKALDEAAQWVDDPANRKELAGILADEAYVDVPRDVVMKALAGDLRFYNGGVVRAECEHALWLYAQMVRWGQTPLSREAEQVVCRTFRPDLRAQALGLKGVPETRDDRPPLDGVAFDPMDVPGYISELPIKA